MQLIQFYLAIFLVFFVPGYFLLRAVFGRNYLTLASLEKLLLTFVFSLASSNAVMLLLNYLNIAIDRRNLFLGIIGTSFVFGVVWVGRMFMLNQSRGQALPPTSHGSAVAASEKAWPHSYRQILLFIVLLGFSVFIRSVYIGEGIFPKTTDFGHHLYWANYININQELPVYSEKFIIGEHLPFAAVSILSRIHYISPLAVIILFLFNIFTLIGVFVLTYWLAVPLSKVFQKIFPGIKKIRPYDVALWALFMIGILYPISAPQVKFVSGGVIGNIIGNFLIVTVIYTFLKIILTTSTIKKTPPTNKNSLPLFRKMILYLKSNFISHPTSPFIFAFLLSTITLVYTHHLSTMILGYSLIAILLAFIILTLIFFKFNLKLFLQEVWQHLKPFFAPLSILIILTSLFFLFQVRMPSYLNSEAIDVAVGTPTKITRVGFNVSGILERVGSWRVLFAGIFGVIVLIGFFKKYFSGEKIFKNFNFLGSKALPPTSHSFAVAASEKALLPPLALSLAILFSWAGVIFLMSWKPALLKVDIPSRRIVTYLTYPIAIMSAFGFGIFLVIIKEKLTKQLLSFLFLFFISIGIISGLGQDINQNYRGHRNDSKETMQTYLSAMYLEKNTDGTKMVLKDHKFLKGDTWMKLFFMRGEKYPLSRTYDRRYEDKINKRETCTRDMVLKPNSEIGQQCFAETNTGYIVLKKGFDDAIFKKLPNFQQIYSSKTVTVFQKK